MTYHQLTQEEQYLIATQLLCGHLSAEIARVLERHRSTIPRELRRHATHHDGMYRAETAHSYAVAGGVAEELASVPRTCPGWRDWAVRRPRDDLAGTSDFA